MNTQNTRVLLSKTNQHEIIEFQYSLKQLKILTSINWNGEIVFHSVLENITTDSYIEMLKEVFPMMKIIKRMIQQDGGSTHTDKVTTQFLNKNYKRWWICLGSNLIECPAHSPDITPCDYGLWLYLQTRITLKMSTTRKQLFNYIISEFHQILKDVITNICNDIQRRCELLIEHNCDNIEHVKQLKIEMLFLVLLLYLLMGHPV